MASGITAGFMLDRQWHWLRGEMDTSKRPALLALGRILSETRTPYAIIGGVALQVHQREPRTTLDIDVALLSRESIPREVLQSSGFRFTDSFAHSENWISTDGTPVQFTADPALSQAIQAAERVVLEEVTLSVIRVVDLLHEKIRSGSDPARRRSKRLQDLADAASLLEERPDLVSELRPEEKEALDRLP